MSPCKVEALVDGHVHFHKQFDLSTFIQSSLQNFNRQAEQILPASPVVYFLFLCETDGGGQFAQLRQGLSSSGFGSQFVPAGEKNTLSLVTEDSLLYIIRGQQIVTKENLEILIFGIRDNSFAKHSLQDILARLEEIPESLTILPWGVGKWLGKRGTLITEVINNRNGSEDSSLFLGDNGNRPSFWPLPKVFAEASRKKIVNLPGSDPLIFSRHAARVGSYGFRLSIELDKEFPFRSLRRQIMTTPDNVLVFGEPCSGKSFFYDQVSLQIRKRMPGLIKRNSIGGRYSSAEKLPEKYNKK